MHIPENYLSPGTCTVMLATMAPVWYVSEKRLKFKLKTKKKT